ncbi:AFR705Wp [Eremothecium gossypii ATCC 10895]|uniref:AFR705Wp n=1 Tax=Eremothecium gossypii (strain ATCC 10895 / CBS 109.51 / FGSC 9923 / NRRL Y-1056) TaxID=284811 RepID=Q751X0_EREGS|nr:AFR705Wp [Eremothecium gossypii ATCC 10895]AAS54077.2 AFR705Wp [Eremothecium gossypii ATCC 10895]AEY98392.1 FAFR705Wp [Eremothecium gossypii FDAG1]
MKNVEVMRSGFLVIPFDLPKCTALGDDTDVRHYMYVKKHQTKVESEANCLFIVNLPLLTQVDSIKESFGRICAQYETVAHVAELLHHDEFGLHEVDLGALTSDFRDTGDAEDRRYTPRNSALLKFVDQASLENCWAALRKYAHKQKELVEWAFQSPSIATFQSFYKPLDLEYLRSDIHEHMLLFEQREQLAQDEVQSSIVDEDGFTLVVGKNTKSLNSIRRRILNRNPLLKHTRKEKPPSMVDKKAKQDFYRFQLREQKKQEINELLSKFKEDQERIKVMKSKRKFNPYS